MITYDGMFVMKGMICVPSIDDLIEAIMQEAYCSSHVMHPGSSKMYRTIKETILVVRYEVRHSRICIQMPYLPTSEGRTPKTRKPFLIPEWKWEHITMDFVVDLPRTQTHHDAI